MCGRFTLTIHALDAVAETLDAYLDPELTPSYRPRYNVAPGDTHWIVRVKDRRREVLPADWGLINHWSKDPAVGFKQINARAETLAQRPAYRDAFARRRCVVPADGFYEWTGPRGAREPIWYHSPERSLLLFAGLYETWRAPETNAQPSDSPADGGEWRKTFTIVTTAANPLVAEVHDRMPVLLALEDAAAWLDGELDPNKAGELLRPAPMGVLAAKPASPRVNSAKHDDADLLDPDDPAAKKQLSLF